METETRQTGRQTDRQADKRTNRQHHMKKLDWKNYSANGTTRCLRQKKHKKRKVRQRKEKRKTGGKSAPR